MKSIILFFYIIYMSHHKSLAQGHLQKGLERLNFFPNSEAYLISQYEHTRLNIRTPLETVKTKEVNNYANIFSLTYAQLASRKMFLGANLTFEQTSENAISYGIPLRRRFDGKGFREPEIFTIYRLREQKNETGLIDLFLSYSPSLGERKVGTQNATRLNGRNILKIELSHGLWEEDWEFKTSLGLNYYGKGKERNAFAEDTFDLESFYVLKFKFNGQYKLNSWMFVYGIIGFNYRSLEVISDKSDERREIQAGTGSHFAFGLKRPLGEWSLVELSYAIDRYEYFVKGQADNLDGDATGQNISLAYKMAF